MKAPRVTLRSVVTAGLIVVSGLTVSRVRTPAEARRSLVKETSESYPLPPPQELVRSSLGYRSALADYLWAHVLVTQGLRLSERRRFETITSYLDAITVLDPDFRQPFLLTDTLTTLQTKAATVDDVRAVRRLLERGVERFPNDAEMWLALGQFVVYVAPASYLTDPEEQQRWRVEGAEYLARAAELGSEDASIAWRAIGGARHLIRAGERDASIRFYERALVVTSDPELRVDLEKRLSKLRGEKANEASKRRRASFEKIWRESFPTMPLGQVFLASPPFAPERCAGGSSSPFADQVECAMTWQTWAARFEARANAEDTDVQASP